MGAPMTAFRVQAKRTTKSGPPADLEFGELAYSDADQRFYIGRADTEEAPATFDGNPTDYGPAIAALTTDLTTLDNGQAVQDTQIATLETGLGEANEALGSQGESLAALTAEVVALDSSQTAQDLSIAAIEADQSIQNEAIANLFNARANLTDAIAAIETDQGNQDNAIAGLNATTRGHTDAIAAIETDQGSQDNAIADLAARPITYGFTYDQQTEPVEPAAGETWRERSAGGLIVGQWEWSAVHAVWVAIAAYDIAGLNITGSGTVASGVADYEEKRRLINYVNLHVIKASGTFNGANYSTITPLLTNAEGAIILNNPAHAVVTTTAGYLVTKKSIVDSILTPARSRINRASVGSPGPTISWMSLNARDIRP